VHPGIAGGEAASVLVVPPDVPRRPEPHSQAGLRLLPRP
jgi:hypothetical protein